jgi:hypothetical protein
MQQVRVSMEKGRCPLCPEGTEAEAFIQTESEGIPFSYLTCRVRMVFPPARVLPFTREYYGGDHKFHPASRCFGLFRPKRVRRVQAFPGRESPRYRMRPELSAAVEGSWMSGTS